MYEITFLKAVLFDLGGTLVGAGTAKAFPFVHEVPAEIEI
jgi:hypothetical protein